MGVVWISGKDGASGMPHTDRWSGPRWLAWLADAPMFIEGRQVGEFDDAVVRPVSRPAEPHLSRERIRQLPGIPGTASRCGADGALSVAQARYRHGGSCRGVCRSAGCPEHCLAANADPGAAAGGIAQATPLTRPYATFMFKTSLSCLAEVRDAWSAERSGGARHRPEAAATRFPTGGGGRSRHAESLPHHGRRGFLADARDTAAGNGRHNVEIALGTRWPAAVPHAPKGS